MSDMGTVTSYASEGLRLWAAGKYPHSPTSCGCLYCSDARAFLGRPPLVVAVLRTAQREERAAS
jgi:hypothetical protein